MSRSSSASNAKSIDEQMLMLIKTVAGMPRSPGLPWIAGFNELISQGASANGIHGDGVFLKIAVQANDTLLCRLLLERGANPNIPIAMRNSIGNERTTLLHEAIDEGYAANETLLNLIAFGADVNAPNSNGVSPKEIAISVPYRLGAQYIFSFPLHAAVKVCKEPAICDRLIQHGHSECAIDCNGQTAEYLARTLGLPEISALFSAEKARRAVDEVVAGGAFAHRALR